MFRVENVQKQRKPAKSASKTRRVLHRIYMKVARGTLPRCACQHHKLDGAPCPRPGSPVVIDPAKPKLLAWACRPHRNEVKRSLGLRIYRKAHQFFPRRKRVMTRIEPWKDEGISHEDWIFRLHGIRYNFP